MRFFRRREKSSTATTKNIDQTLVLHLSKSRIPNLKQLKYAGRFLSPMERLGFYISILIAVGGLIFVASIFYKNHVETIPDEGGHYIEGLVGNPQYINPLYSSLNDADADLEKIIFSRLFTKDENGQAIPDLADKTDISNNGKTYTISLKDAYWHNGETVTADDLIFTFGLIQNPDYRSPLRSRFNGVSIDKVDDKTVVFSLKEPYRDFIKSLDFGIMPSDYWQAVSSQTMPLAELNIKPIGSGPYRFKTLIKTKSGTIKSYVIERNDAYYGSKPLLDEITFKFYASPEEMIAALNNGELNGLSYLSSDLVESIVAKNSLDYHSIALPNLTAIFFNLKSKSAISEKTIRQALAAAIDQDKIVSSSIGKWGISAQSILPNYFPGNRKTFVTDQNKARQLLEGAGWQYRDNAWFKNDQPLTINLIAPDTMKNISDKVAEAWNSLGIKTNVSLQNSDSIEKDILANKQFDVIIYSISMAESDIYPTWRSGSEINISSWSRNDVDRWLEEASLINDNNEAARRYEAFVTAEADDVPAIPLFWEALVYPQTKKIKGFKIYFLEDPAERFVEIANWYIKTSKKLK